MNIAYKIFILFTMIFCHIVDDYYLQGWLASAKQKSWWEKNAPGKLYKYDYLAALFMHSFSWSFMIMLPPTIALMIIGGKWNPLLLVMNLLIHMLVDDMDAEQIRKIEEEIAALPTDSSEEQTSDASGTAFPQ